MNLSRHACCLALLSAFATLFASAAEPSTQDWPQWRGPNRENKSFDTGLLKDWEASPPKLEWKLAGMGDGFASVSIVGNRLYTTGNLANGQHVIAVDLDKQEIAWKQPLTEKNPKHGYDGSRCTPSVDGGLVYAIATDGQIACLKAETGEVVWSKRFDQEWGGRMMSGWGFSESPLVDSDWVLCTPGGDQAMMVALDKRTGEEIWRCALTGEGRPGAGYSSIIVSEAAGVKQYVTLVGRGLIGVRASDGKHLWSYDKIANGTANIPTPVASGDYIFGSSGYGQGGSCLLKLTRDGDGVAAEEVWYTTNKELQNHHGGVVLVGDFLYFGHGHNNGFPVCVELATGKKLWGGDTRGPGGGSAAVTYADDHVVFRYQSGEVALIEATPSKYRLKGVFKPAVIEKQAWAHPVICRGKLFLREQNTLMCYDLTGP